MGAIFETCDKRGQNTILVGMIGLIQSCLLGNIAHTCQHLLLFLVIEYLCKGMSVLILDLQSLQDASV